MLTRGTIAPFHKEESSGLGHAAARRGEFCRQHLGVATRARGATQRAQTQRNSALLRRRRRDRGPALRLRHFGLIGCCFLGLSCAPALRRGAAPGPSVAAGPRLPALDVHGAASGTEALPGGLTCLLRLGRLRVAHLALERLRHVNTPIALRGPIAGVRYRPTARLPFEGDCRLVLALEAAAPLFKALGIRELGFSNVYRPASRGARRLSRHALGLAIDVHQLQVCGARGCRSLRVDRDYVRGLNDACENPQRPILNQLACRLKRGRYFDRVLTPDTNADHRDHFHLAILSFERRRFSRERWRERPIIVD